MDIQDEDQNQDKNQDKITQLAHAYLSDINIMNNLSTLIKINPDELVDEYANIYLKFKKEQEEKSTQEYIPCVITLKSDQIDFDYIEEFDKWINVPEYTILLKNLIDIMRFIGLKLGPHLVASLKSRNISSQSANIYGYDFFKKSSVRPNFLTFLRLLITFGCPIQILNKEFKTFFTWGHKPIGLVSHNSAESKPILTITWNIDTVNEFFKKIDKLNELCISHELSDQFEYIKVTYSKLKNVIIQSVLNKMLAPYISTHDINLCLQECEIDLYEEIKLNFSNIFVSQIFSPQNSQIYQIDNFIDFSINPSIDKIINVSNIVTTFGFATLSTINVNLSCSKVFNSLILNHEKESLKRGITFSTRGIFIPEINLFNLHLKPQQAYKNLISLEKMYQIENSNADLNVFSFDYDFSSKSYTQMFACVNLINKYPNLSFKQVHHIIDVIYDRKMSFDQVLYEISKKSETFNPGYANLLENLTNQDKENICLKYPEITDKIPIDKFIQAIGIHWTKKFEKSICSNILDQALGCDTSQNYSNPDDIIKNFCSQLVTSTSIPTNLVPNPTICGDINMLIISVENTRIKKYSFKSLADQNEPFNHFLNMRMHSWANDIIFSSF